MKRILIVDDSVSVRRLLDEYLSEQGYLVLQARDGLEALAQVEQAAPDLILLDIMMPRLDGFQAISRIRSNSRVPIIMLTSKRHESDVVRGFELGADDYIVKPYRMRVLLMRIRAVLRRSRQDELTSIVLTIGAISLDKNKHLATVDNSEIDLTAVEFCLLERLLESAEHTLNRAELCTHLAEHGFSGSESTLKIHVRNLRGKIERNPAAPRFIETVFGVGYRLREVH
ncbi:MAG: response regulator transcription factor [Chloroflexota bacterium]